MEPPAVLPALPTYQPQHIPFKLFQKKCNRQLKTPLHRFYGAKPLPGQAMVNTNLFLWKKNDPNLKILPKWHTKHNLTMPFVDTHVAVRFLGGVSTYEKATAPNCTDSPGRNGNWCDLVVRTSDGFLQTRYELIRSRLDPLFDNGFNVNRT